MTTSHLLSHPTNPNGKIAMLCYKNGGLARERVRDRFANGDWNVFNNLVEQCPPGCNGYMGFYFPLPEIIPLGVVGEYFFATQITDLNQSSKTPLLVKDIPEPIHPRAIIESQLLSIKSRIAAILPTNSPPLKRLVIAGGSSASETIRQMIAVRYVIDPEIAALMVSRTSLAWTYMCPLQKKQRVWVAHFLQNMHGGSNPTQVNLLKTWVPATGR